MSEKKLGNVEVLESFAADQLVRLRSGGRPPDAKWWETPYNAKLRKIILYEQAKTRIDRGSEAPEDVLTVLRGVDDE